MTNDGSPNQGNSEKHLIQCGEVMSIASAAELKSSLLKALQVGQPIVLIAADVERADTAALQLLTAFFNEATSQGVAVEWHEPSAALCQSARLLGLLDVLRLENKAAA